MTDHDAVRSADVDLDAFRANELDNMRDAAADPHALFSAEEVRTLLADRDALSAEVERLEGERDDLSTAWSDGHEQGRREGYNDGYADAAGESRARVAVLEAELAEARAETASLNISYEALAESIAPAPAADAECPVCGHRLDAHAVDGCLAGYMGKDCACTVPHPAPAAAPETLTYAP